MRFAGYALEHGIAPEHILQLPREDRLIYMAMMKLNQEEHQKQAEMTLCNAMIRFWNLVHGK